MSGNTNCCLTEIGPRRGLALWIAGMVGVLAAAFIMVPALIRQRQHRPLRRPLWVISVLQCVQGGLLLALFAWGGAVLSARVGLHAWVFEALVEGRSWTTPLVRQLIPGLIAGVVLAVIPWYFVSHSLIYKIASPRMLFVGISYGGITEEIFMRWGLMTFLVWLGWRILQRSHGVPSFAIVWTAIIASAVIFGAGHLPATYQLQGHLTGVAIFSVIGGGAVFGVVTGYLYWRYGLESAMICHATAHICAYVACKII